MIMEKTWMSQQPCLREVLLPFFANRARSTKRRTTLLAPVIRNPTRYLSSCRLTDTLTFWCCYIGLLLTL